MELEDGSRAVPRRTGRPLARAGLTAAIVVTTAVAAVVVLNRPFRAPDSILALVWVAVWIASGALVLLRAAPTRMSVLVGCMLLANGVATPVSDAAAGTSSAVLGRSLLAVALTLDVVTLSVFPDGRFVRGWLKGVTVGFVR